MGYQSTELNLQGGSNYEAPNLILSGWYFTVNSSFPELLSGKQARSFWASSQSILVMAPNVSYYYGHDSGIAMFPAGDGADYNVTVVGSPSVSFNGDGLYAYFFLQPLAQTSWGFPFYATGPEAPYVTTPVCSGSIIFPYSHSPYIVVQWEPAYGVAYCGRGTSGSFNLYFVNPAANGSVTASNVEAVGPVGSPGLGGSAGINLYSMSASCDANTGQLTATVSDENNSAFSERLSYPLQAPRFNTSWGASGPYDSAVGAGGYNVNGWGIVYLSTATSGTFQAPPAPFWMSIWTVYLGVGLFAAAAAILVAVVVTRTRRPA